MAGNTTINILSNRYGVDPDLADFVNDLIYSVFFSESGQGIYTGFGARMYEGLVLAMKDGTPDPKALDRLKFLGFGISPDELLPRLQSAAAALLNAKDETGRSRCYPALKDAKVELMLVEETSKGKAVTWKVTATPYDDDDKLISATITGTAVMKQK